MRDLNTSLWTFNENPMFLKRMRPLDNQAYFRYPSQNLESLRKMVKKIKNKFTGRPRK